MDILMQIHMSFYPYLYYLINQQNRKNYQSRQASLCQKFLHKYLYTLTYLSLRQA